MASLASKLLEMMIKYAKLKGSFTEALQSGEPDKWEVKEPPKNLLKKLQVSSSQVNGKNCYSLEFKQLQNNTHILYLHGGGYIFGMNKMHWNFILKLTQKLKCTIVAPDYPLAPEHSHQAVFAMLLNIYQELVAKVGGANIILMGDSAGGGLALALAQKLLEEGLEQPAQIILLSPWLDISLKNPAITPLEAADPILGRADLQMAGKAYAGNTDMDNYLLSPINGQIEGLGKLSIFIGTRDILVADTRKFFALAHAKKVDINYYEYQAMLHDWMLFNLPETRKVIEQIISLINVREEINHG